MPGDAITFGDLVESSYLVHRLATEHGRDARMIPDWIGTTRLTADPCAARRAARSAGRAGTIAIPAGRPQSPEHRTLHNSCL